MIADRLVFAALVGALWIGLIVPSNATAQHDPRRWGDTGIALRQGSHLEWHRAVARNGDGYSCAVWADARHGSREVYAQLISPNGTPLWEDQGLRVTNHPARQGIPAVLAVGEHWIIAWVDWRHTTNPMGWPPEVAIFAQKLDAQGNPLWQENGVQVDYVAGAMIRKDDLVQAIHLAPDLEGGAIIAWVDERRGDFGDVIAQRVSSTGESVWPEPLMVTDTVGGQTNASSASDGMGGMVLAWVDQRDVSDQDLYAAKITAQGELPWGAGVNGVPLATADEHQRDLSVCADLETGGLYAAWHDRREDGNGDIYIQRLDGSGNPVWSVDGVILCDAPSYQRDAHVAPSITDGVQDGVLAAWEDMRVSYWAPEIYAQKVSHTGTHLWGENGTLVCGSGGDELPLGEPRLASDGTGGAICIWEDTREDNGDYNDINLFMSRLDNLGHNVWQDCGVRVQGGDWRQVQGVFTVDDFSSVATVFFNDFYRGSQTLRCRQLALTDGRLLTDEPVDLMESTDHCARDAEIVTMSNSRAAVVWEDERHANHGTALYYQIIDDQGEAELEANGRKLVPDCGDARYAAQRNHDLCPDGSGGFFTAFEDLRTGVKQIRTMHVGPDGEPQCSDSGVVVWESAIDQEYPVVVPDREGGFFVAWSGFSFQFTLDVYVMRVSAECEPVWTEPVQLTTDDTVDDQVSSLVFTPDNACIAVWLTGTYGGYYLQAAKVHPDGDVAWVTSFGEDVRYSYWGWRRRAISDGQGGIFVAWSDERTEATGRDVYVQHIDTDGELAWGEGDVAVTDLENDQGGPRIVRRPGDGVYVIWADFRSGRDLDIFAQRLDENGIPQWFDNGIPIAAREHDQTDFVTLPTSGGGFFAVWNDDAGDAMAVWATDLRLNGSPSRDYWVQEEGGAISDDPRREVQPEAALLTEMTALVAWERWDYVGYYHKPEMVSDLYVQAVSVGIPMGIDEDMTTIPSRFALHQNYPNPFNPSTSISFELAHTVPVTIRVFDLLGREVTTLLDETLTAGPHTVQWDAGHLPSGIYMYRLKAGDFTDTKKLVLLK